MNKRTLDRLEGGAFAGESSFFQGKRFYNPEDSAGFYYGPSSAWYDKLAEENYRR